jgi:hypothetical protein
MVENTRIYRTLTPTVSFADREDFRPKRPYHRENYNPYNPLALQRSRRELQMRDHSYMVGYNIKVKQIDYLINADLDMEAGNKEQHRGFKVDDETLSLWRQYLTGKL